MMDEKSFVMLRKRNTKEYIMRWKNKEVEEAIWILEEELKNKGYPILDEENDQIGDSDLKTLF